MCVVNVYKATNVYSGETIEGTAVEVAEKLGVTATTVRISCKNEAYIKKAWTVAVIGTNRSGSANMYATPTDLFNAWDEVTAPFKALSKKARAKREKEQGTHKE